VSAWKFRKAKDVALYSNYAFRRLNTRVSVFSFYEAATDPIFQPLDLFEFSLQFGCGSQLELRDDFVCVEIDAHDGDPEVKFAGLVLPLNSTPKRAVTSTQQFSKGSAILLSRAKETKFPGYWRFVSCLRQKFHDSSGI
jgi:hypothetical protein